MKHDETSIPLADQLVAYLDGELNAEMASQVERRLAENADDRAQCAELEQAWEMLDVLPKAHSTEEASHVTVAMVAASAQEETQLAVSRKAWRRRLGWLASGMLLLSAAGAGYGVVRAATPDPNEALLRDLPMIESLDLYLYAEDLEFVRQLEEAKLFPEEVDYAAE